MQVRYTLLIILFILNTSHLYSQEKNPYDDNIHMDCTKDKLKKQIVSLNNQKYGYSLVDKNYYASDGNKNYYTGLIILSIKKNEIGKEVVMQILKLIAQKEKLYTLTAIANCKTQKLYYSSTLTKEGLEYVDNHIIGTYTGQL